jgi:hypothetical protein
MSAERMRPIHEREVADTTIVEPRTVRHDDVMHATSAVHDTRLVDHVRWGPILGGFLCGLTSVVLLSMLGLALGITAANPWTSVGQGTLPQGAGWGSLIWAGLASLISYFIGGFVAGRSSNTFDRNWGALNGALVFGLSIPFTMWLASMGAGAILGGLGNFLGGMYAGWGPGNVGNDAGNAANQVRPSDVAMTAEAVRNTSLGTFVGGLLGLLFATLGGMIGTRDRMVREYHDI